MSHIKAISKSVEPAQAESLLVWQQKAAVFGAFATGLGALTNAFNVWTQATDRKADEAL